VSRGGPRWAIPPDVNVLVAASHSDHPHHSAARTWLQEAPTAAQTGATFILMPMVLASVLRLVTSPKIFVQPTPIADAVDFVDAILAMPGVRLAPLGPERFDKNKLYALHAPEVECIGKGKARKPYEFGVKVSLAVTHKQGLMVGARAFPGKPFDGHTLSAQLEQTTNLLQDLGRQPKQAIVDLGYRGVDADNPGVEITHRGKYKTLTALQRRWLKRRQAIEPAIGHTKILTEGESDHRMDRCWLKGAVGDALHAISCAAGYNIRWRMRAIVAQAAKAAKAAFLALSKPALYNLNSAMDAMDAMDALIAVRDVLNSFGRALRSAPGWRRFTLPAIASAGWR